MNDHQRLSSLHADGVRLVSNGEPDSLSVSDEHEDDEACEMRNCGSGDVDRDGTGVELAVDETEVLPE